MKAALIVVWTVIWSFALWIPERILWLLGLPLVAISSPFAHVHPTKLTRDGKPLWVLPFWTDWCWGNKDDGFGDINSAVNDLGYKSWEEYMSNGFWSQWHWLAIKNPCHNMNHNIWLYNCNFNRAKNVDFAGSENVDNRMDSNGKLMSGFQCVWASGSFLYFRSGIYWILPLWSGRCLRLRLGAKIQPRHMIESIREKEPVVLWTLSFSPYKRVITQ